MAEYLLSNAHSVGEAHLHLVFTPAYRRRVFTSRVLRDVLLSLFQQEAQKDGFTLAAVDFGPDHVHLFLAQWKRWSIAALAQRLKGATSRTLRRDYRYLFVDKLWGGKFWTGGYFYRTVGAVTADTVRRYVEESQGKHWIPAPTLEQRTIVAYV